MRRKFGDLPLSGLRAKYIRRGLQRFPPAPANNRLKVWRALGRWWVDAGLLDEDPARDVRRRATQKTDGWTAWERGDLDLFRDRWPHHTPQRMAMELMYRTCASIGDACRLGPGKVDRDGWLTYRRGESGSEATCPFLTPGPEWFEGTDDLAKCLDHAPRALTYLAAQGGHPRSPKAATQWFSRACRDAGLSDGKTAHGLRKLRAAMFRENGTTEDQRMAILGHDTTAEAKRYSRLADLRRVITGTESSNSVQLSDKEKGKSVG